VIDEAEKTQLACYPKTKHIPYEAPVEKSESVRTSMKSKADLPPAIKEGPAEERLRTRHTIRPELVRAVTGSILASQDYSNTSAPFTELTGY